MSESELWNVIIVDFCRARWRLATRWKTVQIPPYLATEDGKCYMFQRHPWDRRLSQVLESNFGLLSKLEVQMNADGQGCSNIMWVLANQIVLFLSLVLMECISWACIAKGIYTHKNENIPIGSLMMINYMLFWWPGNHKQSRVPQRRCRWPASALTTFSSSWASRRCWRSHKNSN